MKTIIACLLVLASLAIMAGCTGNTETVANMDKTTTSGVISEKAVNVEKLAAAVSALQSIDEAAAKSAALKHAGLSASDVTYIKCKLDIDDGRTVYDVEFYSKNTEYDYEIDAVTGKIVSYDYDVENYTVPSTSNSNNSTDSASKTAAASEYIGESTAKSAALKHAGLSTSDITYIKCKLDIDDGRTVYDVEFYSKNTEYDYEIDAVTGKIVSYDYDVENYTVPSTSNSNNSTDSASKTAAASEYIGESTAKSAALKHAGLSTSDITYIKCKLDIDDRRTVYDVEFYSKNTEYDYEIDAVTGKIVSYDYDAESYTAPSANDNNTAYISLDEARKTALTKANLASDQVTYTEAEYEYDDGIAVYQIEFISGGTEYEFEINAVNGKIIEYDVETND